MQFNKRNLTLLTDFYELTMMQGYYLSNKNETAVFDLFYRSNPCGNGYSILCGLNEVIEYINSLHFDESDIEYLRSLNTFDDRFLEYLKNFKFTGDIYSIKEGSIIFPTEPLIKVVAPICEAQLLETALLNIINHQSLIATKASRVVEAAKESTVMEFGLRRAQGPDAGILGAKACVIAGCIGTSNTYTSKIYNIPALGTCAHSWIMSFDDEYTAFKTYSNLYPDNCILLCDTYNILKSGVPNAIKVFQEMKENGISLNKYGIRIDSGDLAYFSKEARKMLDEAGFEDAIISASSDLDEYIISDLKVQGAKIDSFGVGTSMITSKDTPAFGGVYKLSAIIKNDGTLIPKIKISENTVKITNPGNKTVYRIIDNETSKIKADLISLSDEKFDTSKDLTIYDPSHSWKKTTLKKNTYTLKEILIPIFKNGKQVYNSPTVSEIKSYCKLQKELLWPEQKRINNPEEVHVDISDKLYDLKFELINQYSK